LALPRLLVPIVASVVAALSVSGRSGARAPKGAEAHSAHAPETKPRIVDQETLTPTEERAVNALVAHQAKRLARANEPVDEFRDARKVAHGELDGDGQRDLVLLFTLEQGNNWTQFLAAFSGPDVNPVATARVGGKGERSIALSSVTDRRIGITTMSYRPSDALCCPSVAGRSWFALRRGALVEETR